MSEKSIANKLGRLLDDEQAPQGIFMAPAFAVGRGQSGPIFVLSPDTLLGKTAFEIRHSGLVIPESVPDQAVVVRDSKHGLVYKWTGQVAQK